MAVGKGGKDLLPEVVPPSSFPLWHGDFDCELAGGTGDEAAGDPTFSTGEAAKGVDRNEVGTMIKRSSLREWVG
jgi:hypothetical protein